MREADPYVHIIYLYIDSKYKQEDKRQILPAAAPPVLGVRPEPRFTGGPLVVAAAQARLAGRISVDLTVDPGAQLEGDSFQPATLRIVAPERFVLSAAAGFSPATALSPLPGQLTCVREPDALNACTVRVPGGVRLRAGIGYGIRLEDVATPAALEVGELLPWRIEAHYY